MIRLVEQIYNRWQLWIYPDQSTKWVKFRFRAWPHIVPISNPFDYCISI